MSIDLYIKELEQANCYCDESNIYFKYFMRENQKPKKNFNVKKFSHSRFQNSPNKQYSLIDAEKTQGETIYCCIPETFCAIQ
jgi:hypothetical protein